MKKKFYFATLVIALLTFTGCANDEYVGDQQNLGEQNGAIAFSTKSENTVRAGEIDGEGAATRLNKQFWVYGTKNVTVDVAPKDQLVFDGYKVVYDNANKSTSNTTGWEYVGKGENNKTQTIKYWDYGADKYEFEAYSYKSSNQNAKVQRNTNSNSGGEYSVKNLDEGDYATLYFAEKKTVLKTNETVGEGYKDPVTLKFKSVLSKIRVGFYETIPGYSVKIDGFYGLNESGNGWATAPGNTQEFVAWCPNKAANPDHPFVVTYVTDNNVAPAVTTPTVTKVANGANSDYIAITNNGSYKLDAKLTLGTNFLRDQVKIGDTYSAVTWDNVDNNNKPIYTYFIPQNQLVDGTVNEMKIKVDYTLTSTDGSGEKIKVTGATAIVPGEYLKWKPNTAYSYVFKISDNTNGSTGTPGTDPAGLYPITFDAVVEDMAESTDHLTTVSDLSITATQGKQFAEADKAVFKTGDAINVKVMRYNNESPDDITDNVSENSVNGDSFTAVFVDVAKYNSNKSLEKYITEGNTENTYHYESDKVVIKLNGQPTAGYWIVKVTFMENTGSVRDITKYAVLKVGTVPTSPSQEGGE